MGRALASIIIALVCVSIVRASDCGQKESKWDKYLCETMNGPKLQPGCIPKFRLTNASQAKGLVAVFHGYTACPDSFDPLAESWLADGFHVIQFLTPGHGRIRNSECDVDGNFCAPDGDRIEGLPVNRKGYSDFVEIANAIVLEEKELRGLTNVTATGLSMGGPLATYAGSTGGSLYSQLLIMNPFYGISVPPLDKEVLDCTGDFDACTRTLSKHLFSVVAPNSTSTDIDALVPFVQWALKQQINANDTLESYSTIMALVRLGMSTVAENPDILPTDLRNQLDKAVMGWGESCEIQITKGRQGICSFRVRNLLAAHSFGQYAMQQAGLQEAARPSDVQIVMVERDGATRNSLAMQAAANYKRKTSTGIGACMYRLVPDCTLSGNECGVPHSMLSRVEQTIPPPYELYWEAGLMKDSISFLNTGSAMGTQADPARDKCIQLNIDSPPEALVLPVASNIYVTVKQAVTKDLERKAQLLLSNAIKDVTGLKIDFAVNMVDSVKKTANFVQLVFELPGLLTKEQAEKLESAVASGKLEGLINNDILNVEVAGRTPVTSIVDDIDWIKSQASGLCAGVSKTCDSVKTCTRVAYGDCDGDEASQFLHSHLVGSALLKEATYLTNPSDVEVLYPAGNGYVNRAEKTSHGGTYAYNMNGVLIGNLNTFGMYAGVASYFNTGSTTIKTNVNEFYLATADKTAATAKGEAPVGPANICISEVTADGACGAERTFGPGAYKFSIFGYTSGTNYAERIEAKTADHLSVRVTMGTYATAVDAITVKINAGIALTEIGNTDVKKLTLTSKDGKKLTVNFDKKYNVGPVHDLSDPKVHEVTGTHDVKIRVSQTEDKEAIYVDYLFDLAHLSAPNTYFVYDPTVTVEEAGSSSSSTSTEEAVSTEEAASAAVAAISSVLVGLLSFFA